MSKKTILVTGSAGFIGSNFVRKAIFNKTNYNIVSVDVCKGLNSIHNVYANKGHKFHIGDITDKHFIDTIFKIERPDICLNFAAESFVDSAISDACPFINSNVLGTQILIDASLKYNLERFIQVSTDEVYGHLTDDTSPGWVEDAFPNPRNPYSASKYASELLIKAAHQTHGLNYNITRSCNNFGPRQQARNFIPKVIKSVLNNTKMPIFGQGKQIREWVHVEDNCNAILTILEKGELNQVYNISSGFEFSNLEVFHEICNVFEKGYDLIEFVKDRPGHDFRYSCNSSKLRSLGWEPKVKFKQGLNQTCHWYQNNQWFIK